MPRTWHDMSDAELREVIDENPYLTANHREAANELHDRLSQRVLAQLYRIEPAGALTPSALATARALADGKPVKPDALKELGREVVAIAPKPAAKPKAPATEKPATENPTTAKPAAEKPAAEKPKPTPKPKAPAESAE